MYMEYNDIWYIHGVYIYMYTYLCTHAIPTFEHYQALLSSDEPGTEAQFCPVRTPSEVFFFYTFFPSMDNNG